MARRGRRERNAPSRRRPDDGDVIENVTHVRVDGLPAAADGDGADGAAAGAGPGVRAGDGERATASRDGHPDESGADAQAAADAADAADDAAQEPYNEHDEPMLQLAHFASNDEWAFRQADRQASRLRTRTHDKDDRTEGGAFDAQTMQILHKFLIHHVIKSVDLPIAEGKEASVFRATTPRGGLVAVKIFRINTATFHNFLQYIQGDERFQGLSGDRRTMMKAWTHKEFRNLRRLREVGCSVPEPIKAVGNVLLMEFLGKKEGPWPQIREARMADPEACYRSVIDDLVLAHNEAGLVHADISEYNILLENADVQDPALQRPRLIDVGQAVLHTHPMAGEFLKRDIRNVTKFFGRKGVDAKPEDITSRLRAPDHERWRKDEEE